MQHEPASTALRSATRRAGVSDGRKEEGLITTCSLCLHEQQTQS